MKPRMSTENLNVFDFLGTPEGQLEDLLRRIAAALQLTPAQYDLVDQRYEGITRYLDAPGSPLADHDPRMFAQGSRALGTTVKPWDRQEFDLDFVMKLRRPQQEFEPIELLMTLYNWLKANGNYAHMLELKKRCVRLSYAEEFHIDILPAVPDLARGGTCILVPCMANGGDGEWSPSDPEGYVERFNNRAAAAMWAETLAAMKAQVDPLPELEQLHEKPPLKVVVQLVKRHRDVVFNSRMERAPISIVLTTLASELYRGAQSVTDALTDCLAAMCNEVRRTAGVLIVRNPTNFDEILSERWLDNPKLYAEFERWLFVFSAHWSRVQAAEGAELSKLLKEIFGVNAVDHALKQQANVVHAARKSGLLSVTPAGVLTVGHRPDKAVPVRDHRFYGA